MEHIDLQGLIEYSRTARVVKDLFSGPNGSMSFWYVLKKDRDSTPSGTICGTVPCN